MPTKALTSSESVAPARSHRDLRASLLLGLLCLFVYNANLRVISAGDAYPARYLPFGIWRYHTLALDPILVPAILASALLKLPFVASAGLSRVSRNQVIPNCDTSVGWLNNGISSEVMFRLLTVTLRNA